MVFKAFLILVLLVAGLPTWGSDLIFAIATIFFGALLGLVIVFSIDFIYPPQISFGGSGGSPPHKRSKDSGDEEDDHPDVEAEEQLTALRIYKNKLKLALNAKDVDKVTYYLALVEGRIAAVKDLKQDELTEAVRTRLQQELTAAEAEWQNSESILEMVRGLVKSVPTTAYTSDGHTSMQWKWTPLPFHGKKGEWLNWWETFSSAIHNDAALGAEWKMKALIECLKGEAADVLGKMERTGENYQRAIKLLQDRFGDPIVLSKAYYEQLEKIPPSVELKTQRQTLDKVGAIVRNLESLKTKIQIDESSVARHICQKFTPEFLRWAVHDLSKEQPDMNFPPLTLITAMENMMKVDSYLSTQRQTDEETQEGVKAIGVLSVGTKRPRPSEPLKPSRCVYCTLNHPSADCHRFDTILSRRNRLTELKRCHNCLILHHYASTCRMNLAVCRRCTMRHHTALCTVQLKKSKQG